MTRVRVVEVVEETADARSLVLDLPADWTYLPGQFVTLRVEGVARRESFASQALRQGGAAPLEKRKLRPKIGVVRFGSVPAPLQTPGV